MRYIFPLLILLLTSQVVSGQIPPIFSKYLENQFILNPSLTGNKEHVDIYSIYQRNPKGHLADPQSLFLCSDGAIKNGKLGFGGFFYMDRLSISKNTLREYINVLESIGGNFSAAYHHKFKNKHRLSFGFSVMFQKSIYEYSLHDDFRDIQIWNSYKGNRFDANIGVNYSFKGLNIGFSVPHLAQFELESKSANTINFNINRKYFTNISYEFSLAKNNLFIEPGIQLQLNKGNDQQVNALGKISYKKIAWLTAMYSHNHFTLLGAGVQLHKRLSLNYLGNIIPNISNNYYYGIHEIMLGVRLGSTGQLGLIETIKSIKQINKI